MAKILCVCISKERKTSSQNIHECEADLQGLVGDVHYGRKKTGQSSPV